MAISVYGVTANLIAGNYAKAHAILAAGNGAQVVSTGLVCSVATGTRLVSVTLGTAAVAGVLVESATAATVTLPQNTSGKTRIDVVVLQVSWAGTESTAGTLTSVTGTPATTPVAPSLTQTPGTLWQIPLAYVTVANGVGQLAGGTVDVCKPTTRKAIPYYEAIDADTVAHAAVDHVLATQTIADPGWPYYVAVAARVQTNNSTDGHSTAKITVDGVSLGTTGNGTQNTDPIAFPMSLVETPITGSVSVQLTVTPVTMTNALSVTGGRLSVLVLPA